MRAGLADKEFIVKCVVILGQDAMRQYNEQEEGLISDRKRQAKIKMNYRNMEDTYMHECVANVY